MYTKIKRDFRIPEKMKGTEATMFLLQQAIEHGDVDVVADIISDQPLLTKKKCVFHLLPIQYASEIGALPIVELLIQLQGNTDARGCRKWTALHSAALNGHSSVVEILVRRGHYAIDAHDTADMTPMCHALRRKHLTTVEKLIQLGSKALKIADSHGHTPIHNITFERDTSSIETILRLNPAIIDLTTFHFRTPLDLAVARRNEACMKVLVALGGKCNIPCEVPSQPSEEETLDIRYRIYFARSLVSRLLFSIIN